MPNWCQNNLEVSGDETQLKEFVEKSLVKSKEADSDKLEFTLEGLYPTPPELLEGAGWYDWRVENWGTKWDADNSYISEDNIENFRVSFDTAWGPPTHWLKKVSMRFPNLSFVLDYMEEGMGFCGVLTIADGEITQEEGEPVYYDVETGDAVYYDSETDEWLETDTDEVIDRDERENFYPAAQNPFI